MYCFDSIENAISDIRLGKMVIVVDDENRENEGDFIMAADMATPEAINFMATQGRGLICTPITNKRAKELDLDLMIKSNKSLHQTAFTVSVDYIDSGTGISAEDRAKTIKAIVNQKTKPEELLRPGHIFPLIANDGGVLVRDGHTEAAVDLAKLAGLSPAGIICEISNPDGSMARQEKLFEMAKKFDLKIITIKDLISYRNRTEVFIDQSSSIPFPCNHGEFELCSFKNTINGEHHLAFIKGNIQNVEEPLLVRVHSECFTGDIFGSKRCDCGDQLKKSLSLIEKKGKGILIYLRQEGRGIGLENKLKAYSLQDEGFDTISANHQLGFEDDLREYSFAAQILKFYKVKKVELLTNNPLKVSGLEENGINIAKKSPLEVCPNENNLKYLETKRDRMGHQILNLL
ncbi:bifunctional 3,4-dihydroxy-2-butanone-4-phosphate synthase/GTP cyclohydrolase II [Bacteriovoracales bacterium]|nr:bifunctional 3,4-dihydroxy-2-butanone-4-phosphate synthase/GTP cyclohydrolase II [Bacteriovoracales bacterium]